MPHDRLYLADIVEAADTIALLLQGFDETAFLADLRTQAAVAFHIANIGEAVNGISASLKQRYSHVSWAQARSMRNFLAHRYFAIDWSIVWEAATHDLPLLRQQIASILAAEFPDTT